MGFRNHFRAPGTEPGLSAVRSSGGSTDQPHVMMDCVGGGPMEPFEASTGVLLSILLPKSRHLQVREPPVCPVVGRSRSTRSSRKGLVGRRPTHPWGFQTGKEQRTAVSASARLNNNYFLLKRGHGCAQSSLSITGFPTANGRPTIIVNPST
jgi:hypothetical protein